MIQSSCLPVGTTPSLLPHRVRTQTTAGTFDTSRYVDLQGLILPEFDKQKQVALVQAFLFNAPCRYDVILGRDFLSKAQIDIQYSSKEVKWLDRTITMKPLGYWEQYSAWESTLDDSNDELESYFSNRNTPTKILDAKYDAVSVQEVIDKQKHLNDSDKELLRNTLEKHKELFRGKLGRYPHSQVSLELEEGARPFHKRPYPVAQVHLETFKKELQHLVKIGVLRACGPTRWGSPTFIIPKKDGRVRWVSDFRELN